MLRHGGTVLAIVVALALPAAASADFPYAPGGDPSNPSTWHITPPTAPDDFDATEFKGLATPESGNTPVNNQADELCGIRGDSLYDTATTQPAGSCATGAVHTAWNVTTGRPDVVISVLDSGIEWNKQDAMADLRFKVHLNRGELPEPEKTHAAMVDGVDCDDYSHSGYDINGDGVFNLLDYACDDRVATDGLASPLRHGPSGYLTPEDLIIAFSNHDDHDGNGYVDDIAGWDFVDDKNDPYDDVQYGHGTGEARDSNAEADNKTPEGGPSLGTCPNCMVMPLRVGESFVADANRFAQATLYATDNGASVVQEALGTLNAPRFARQAIDYAYDHGVTVIASAADEAAEHHNQPGALPHTIVVNSVRKYDDTFTSTPKSYLQFNGCTNFSTRVTLAVPSTSCSSEATGRSAGVAGLIYSAALNAHETTSDCHRIDGSACPITPTEVRELMASGHIGGTGPADEGDGGQADDVNFAGTESDCSTHLPTCTDPNSNSVFAADQALGVVGPLPDTRRYHARKGFDEFYGYGRLNAYRAVHAASDGDIPPEADITSPEWFEQVDPAKSTFAVDGYVNAREDYKCKVEVAPGGQPNNTADFVPVPSSVCDGTTAHSEPFRGTLANVSTSTLKALFPITDFAGNENGGTAQTSNGRPNTMPYAFTVRVVVTTAGTTPMSGEDRRQAFLHRDQDMLPHFPIDMKSDGDSSPLLVDLDGDNRNELVVANSDGIVHAYRPDGSELPGWPVHTRPLADHNAARAYSAGDGVGPGHYNAVLGALASGDLFGDGRQEIVADDNGGNVYAWDEHGNEVFHQESDSDFSGAPLTPFHTVRQGPRDRTEHGFLSSPVLADLDGGGLDLIAAGDDRHVYAWHSDGSAVDGFPHIVVDPAKVGSIDASTGHVTFNSTVSADPGIDEDQGKIIDTPAVAQVDGADKPPTIFLGTNEEYPVGGDEGDINAGLTAASLGVVGQTGILGFANGRVYALENDGTIAAGWPKKVGIIDRGLLPDVGEGVNGSPVVAPITCPSGGQGMKVAVAPDAGPGYVFNPDGSSCYGSSGGADNTLETDFAAAAPQKYDTPTFPAVGYPAFGTLESSASEPDIFMPTTGLIRALDVVAPEYQGGQDFISGWNANTGQFRAGFPAPVNDLQFLTGQAIGDVAGVPGTQQVLGGTASLDLQALNSAGVPASTAWPKLTGDWTVATPTLGSFGTLDTDGDSHKVVVSLTRAGTLAVYDTPAAACSPSSSPRFHHDNANSGDYTRDAIPPGKPYDESASAGDVTFKAPGDDLLCGQAKGYQLVTSDEPVGASGLAGTTIVATAWDPGSAHTAPTGPGRYVALRFVDDQGNVGRTLTFDRGSSTGVGAGPGPTGGTADSPGCSDRSKPRSSRLRRRAGRHGIRLHGRARDRGCAGIKRELVSVAKVRGDRCRFLKKSGRLTSARSCRRPVLLRARGAGSWTLHVSGRLPPGRYRLVARAVDSLGNRELPAGYNRMRFRIR